MKCRTKTVDLRLALSGIFQFWCMEDALAKCSAAQSIQPISQSNLQPNYFGLFPSSQAIVMHMKKQVYTKWCWWWFFNTIFCIRKISSQCYKMKLYQFRWSYHFHLRFRLTLRDIHRWFAACLNFANQRQEFIHESTPAETQEVLIRRYTNLKKTQEKPTGTKKLHSISEVKFSRSSTPFDKDPKKPDQSCNWLQIIRFFNLRHRFFSASVVC